MQPGRAEEEGHEKAVGDALQAREDVALHLMRQPRQGDAEEQRAQRSVQAEHFGAHDRYEQDPQDQGERQVRDFQQAFQRRDQTRNDPGRQHPRHQDEAGDLPQQEEHSAPARGVSVLPDGQPHQQQQQKLGDDRDREQLDPDRFPQAAGIDQHLGEDAQAGQGQDSRESHRRAELELQSEIVEQIEGDDQRGRERNDDRDDRGHEVPAADRRHERGDVDFVQTDEEEIEEDAEAQENVNVAGELDDAQNGPEKHSGRRVGDDRVQPETSEYALGQLRDDDQQADGQQGVFEHVRVPGRGRNGVRPRQFK